MAAVRPINPRKKTKRKTKNSTRPSRTPRPGNVATLTSHDERLKSLLDLSSEWYWEQDENFRFRQITGGAFAKSGFNAHDYLGKTRWDNGGMPVGDGGSWDNHRALLEAHQPFTNFMFTRIDANGAVHYVKSSGQPIFNSNGRFVGYRGIASDITARRHEERLLALEHTVNRTLAVAETLSSGVQTVTRAV